jgi:Arc/MetJ-type ribon-helix-helix transcriptional regulator
VKLITCHLPEAYLSGIEELVSLNVYPNRSEVIRVAVRDLLKEELNSLIRMKKEQEKPI